MLCKRMGAGHGGERDGGLQLAAVRLGEDHNGGPTTRARRFPSRCRSSAPIRNAGAGRALYNVDAGRTDHRHQHGLPGEENLQCDGWFRADAGSERELVAEILAAVVGAVDAPVTLKMRTRLGQEQPQMRCASRRSPKPAASRRVAIHGRTRGLRLHRRGGIRHYRGGEGQREHSIIATATSPPQRKPNWWNIPARMPV